MVIIIIMVLYNIIILPLILIAINYSYNVIYCIYDVISTIKHRFFATKSTSSVFSRASIFLRIRGNHGIPKTLPVSSDDSDVNVGL